MNKWLLLVAGTLFLAATVQADCGKCESAKDAAQGAECKMKAAKDKAACTAEKAESCKKEASDKAASEVEKAKVSKDNASDQAQQKRKKWWKFGLGE